MVHSSRRTGARDIARPGSVHRGRRRAFQDIRTSMKIRVTFAALLLGVLAGSVGCANLPAISARVINCPRKDVVVSDVKKAINNSSWTATCHGESYLCHGANNLVTCAPLGVPPNGVSDSP
jgi:hypothetical protein